MFENKKQAQDTDESRVWQEMTFPPNCKGKLIFNFFLFFATLFSTFHCTYVACFGASWRQMITKIEVGCELMFLADIVLNFFMQYADVNDGWEMQKRPIKIAKRYIFGSFLFDAVAMVPFFLALSPTEIDK